MPGGSTFAPPACANPIRIDRYSPYFKHYSEYGWSSIRPQAHYSGLHPHLSADELSQVAYHFDGEGGVTSETYLGILEAAIDEWRVRHTQGDGLFLDPREGLLSNQEGKTQKLHPTPVAQAILDRTHEIISVAKLMAETGCSAGVLDRMVHDGILYIENQKALNLAVRTEALRTYACS